jgi:hypothetical protein
MAMIMFYLIVFTLIASFVGYAVGFALRKFVQRYRDFQYRLSLPIIAYCAGSIIALLLMNQAMSLFLVDALYRLSLVRRYPEFIIGSLNVVAYALGGYCATKYTVRLAHKLDLRRITKRNNENLQTETVNSLSEVGRDLFRVEDEPGHYQVKE